MLTVAEGTLTELAESHVRTKPDVHLPHDSKPVDAFPREPETPEEPEPKGRVQVGEWVLDTRTYELQTPDQRRVRLTPAGRRRRAGGALQSLGKP